MIILILILMQYALGQCNQANTPKEHQHYEKQLGSIAQLGGNTKGGTYGAESRHTFKDNRLEGQMWFKNRHHKDEERQYADADKDSHIGPA